MNRKEFTNVAPLSERCLRPLPVLRGETRQPCRRQLRAAVPNKPLEPMAGMRCPLDSRRPFTRRGSAARRSCASNNIGMRGFGRRDTVPI